MTQGYVIELLQQLLGLTAIVAAPLLLAGLVVGLLVAVFQAATQIQESSLGFVPKLVAMGGALAWAGPWALEKMVGLTTNVLEEIVQIAPGGVG